MIKGQFSMKTSLMCMFPLTNCRNTWSKTDRTARRNRSTQHQSWRLQHPSIRNGQVLQTENQQGHSWTKQHHRSSKYNWYQLGKPNTPEYTFLSSSHGTFTKSEHILGNKTHLHKFKKLEIICLLSGHNGFKLGMNSRKIAGKIPKYLEIKLTHTSI